LLSWKKNENLILWRQ